MTRSVSERGSLLTVFTGRLPRFLFWHILRRERLHDVECRLIHIASDWFLFFRCFNHTPNIHKQSGLARWQAAGLKICNFLLGHYPRHWFLCRGGVVCYTRGRCGREAPVFPARSSTDRLTPRSISGQHPLLQEQQNLSQQFQSPRQNVESVSSTCRRLCDAMWSSPWIPDSSMMSI